MKKYNVSADMLRVSAALGVVIIHTANAVYGRPDYLGGISWWFAILLNSLSRTSIPLFIMLSGYFLLSNDETLTQSMVRLLRRVVVPLLFWFIVYVIWNGGTPSLTGINASLVMRLLTVNVFDLYFLIIFIGLYAVAPLLRAWLRNVAFDAQKTMTGGLLLFGSGMFLSDYLLSLCSPTNSFTYWLPYTGLFVAGYFLGNHTKLFRTGLLLGVFVLMTLITAVMSYVYLYLVIQGNNVLNAHGCLTYYSDSYLSVNVVLMSLSVFLLVMRTDFSRLSKRAHAIIYVIARNTFGIYVLHTMVLDVFDRQLQIFDGISPLWLYAVSRIFVIFTVSFVISWMLMKIPIFAFAFGERRQKQVPKP